MMSERSILWLSIACVLLVGPGCRSGSNETHYAELESNRREQTAQAAPSALGAATSPSPQASVAASPSASATTQTAPPDRNYWTNFRGPKRDGKYDEAPVSTNWPAKGLPLIWKQPVGVGH